MDEPADWRELASKFSELAQLAGELRAIWCPPSTGISWFLCYSPWSFAHLPWPLGDSQGPVLESRFLNYAERAAVLLGQPPGPNAAFYWLDLLKERSYHYVMNLTLPDGGGQLEPVQCAVIEHVCAASADHCYALETLAVAREHAKSMPTIGPESSATTQPESHNPETIGEQIATGPANRRAAVDAFIAKVAEAGRKITRKDIWTVAGYTDATEFERFQRDDARTTPGAELAFNRVLRKNPEDFILLLDKKPAAK